ncbi:hypothetical protein Tco_0694429 [Tanacetum coccineum]
MENLPPPNNDLNIPEDEHAPAPEHAPIAPNPPPIQPNNYLANDEADPEEEPEVEEEPIPEQAPVAPVGFAPQWIGGHDQNNNNGWIEKDDEDEVEAKEEDVEEIEDEEVKEIEVKDNDGENDDVEVYNPYEEVDPLNRPPPSPDTAKREIMNAPVTQSTLQPIPPIRQFSGTFYVGKGSSATVFNPALCKVYPLDLCFDDDLKALDSTFREQMQEMKKLVARETPYDPFTNLTFGPRRVDPYVMVRDNAVRVDAAGDRGGESVDTTTIVKDFREKKDDEGDAAAAKDSQPSESRGSPRNL